MTDPFLKEDGGIRPLHEESWRDGVSRLSDNVAEALDATRAVGAIARRLRVLAANTSIEAARVPGAVALGEIARRMRVLSEEASELHTNLENTLHVQVHAVSELHTTLHQALSESDAPDSLLMSPTRTIVDHAVE